jgi:hypothetical protein
LISLTETGFRRTVFVLAWRNMKKIALLFPAWLGGCLLGFAVFALIAMLGSHEALAPVITIAAFPAILIAVFGGTVVLYKFLVRRF